MHPLSLTDKEKSISVNGWMVSSNEKLAAEWIASCDSMQNADAGNHLLFKETPEKRVFLLRTSPCDMVVKHQMYRSIPERWKATLRHFFSSEKMATATFREANHLISANRKSIPSPRFRAYAVRKKSGVVCEEILVSDACPDTRSLEAYLQTATGKPRLLHEYLIRSFQLIHRMVMQNFIHLDLHTQNILLSSQDRTKDSIIDFEYCMPLSEKEILSASAFAYGYLFRCHANRYVAMEDYKHMVDPFRDRLTINAPSARSRFDALFIRAATTRISKRDRKKDILRSTKK